MSQKLFYVDTSAAANFRKMRVFIGGVEVDLTDPAVRSLNIPLAGNLDFWIVVSQTPVSSGYTAKINDASSKVDLPCVDSSNGSFDLDTKITFQTNPGSVDVTDKEFTIKQIWGTAEASPTDNDWVKLGFDLENRTISKLNGANPLHLRFDLEMNPFGGADTQLNGAGNYDGNVSSSLFSETWTFVKTLAQDDSQDSAA